MSLTEQALLLTLSLIANWFSALSGGGAGLIQFPLLIYLGLPFGIALATHKAATLFLGIGATLRYLRENELERDLAITILAWGVPGVIIGATTILTIPGEWATRALGVLTLSLGIYSIASSQLGLLHQPRNRDRRGRVTGGFGLFLIGILNGSLTSGTGLFLTLWLIHHFGLDYKRAVAYTLILCGFVWNGTGALVLGTLSTIHWPWMPALIVGSLVGGYLGSHLAITRGSALIKRAFEITTVAIGLHLLVAAGG